MGGLGEVLLICVTGQSLTEAYDNSSKGLPRRVRIIVPNFKLKVFITTVLILIKFDITFVILETFEMETCKNDLIFHLKQQTVDMT